MWDAIVVGAGPAGSSAALRLARRGLAVCLLERERFPRAKPCGEFLSPAATPILEELGVREAVEAAGARRLPRVRIVAHGEILDLGFPDGLGAPPWCYALSRKRLDAILLDAAREAGVEVREGVRVEGLVRESDRVAGVLGRARDDRPLAERARLVVGAGGRNCPVARALGLQRRARRRRYDLLAHWVAAPAGADPACELHVAGDAYLAVAPVERDRWNVNGVVSRAALRRTPDPEALYADLLAAHPAVAARVAGGARAGEVTTSDVTPLLARRAIADGVVLVGDAALFLDPFTGQGIYLALRSAALAVPVAATALERGRVDRQALAPYEAARRAEFASKRTVSRIIQIILYRPRLARRLARGLARRRDLADLLAAATGDLVLSDRVASPRYAARLAAAVLLR